MYFIREKLLDIPNEFTYRLTDKRIEQIIDSLFKIRI